MIAAASRRAGYWAAIGHRLSGLLLALFLPVHFLVLGLAIEGAARLDSALRLADNPWVAFAEWGLVVVLSVHLAFGLRVLAIEFLAWPGHLKGAIGLGGGAALAVGFVFLWNLG